MIELKVEKMYDDVVLPKFQQNGDVGLDIHSYLCDESGELVKSIKIWPNSSAKIHTGLKFCIPQGYFLELHLRSSAGVKKDLRLKNTVGIIDTNFSHEMLMFIKNEGNEPVEILNGERIAQIILRKVEEVEVVQVDKVEQTERGAGFGSSGRV